MKRQFSSMSIFGLCTFVSAALILPSQKTKFRNDLYQSVLFDYMYDDTKLFSYCQKTTASGKQENPAHTGGVFTSENAIFSAFV